MKVRNENFITILAPMITVLGLKGNELVLFALIHGFSQDGESRFKATSSYMMDFTGLSRRSVFYILKNLEEKKYISKYEYEINNVKVCEYSSNYYEILDELQECKNCTSSAKIALPPCKNCTTPVQKLHNPLNSIDKHTVNIPTDKNNNNNILKKKTSILTYRIKRKENEEQEKEHKEETHEPKSGMNKPQKTLFRNSEVYKLVKFDEDGNVNDTTELLNKFNKPEFENVDMLYYFFAVADWSDSSNTMRTGNGWLATIRNFIRNDLNKGTLHTKTPNTGNIDLSDALDYLNNNL